MWGVLTGDTVAMVPFIPLLKYQLIKSGSNVVS